MAASEAAVFFGGVVLGANVTALECQEQVEIRVGKNHREKGTNPPTVVEKAHDDIHAMINCGREDQVFGESPSTKNADCRKDYPTAGSGKLYNALPINGVIDYIVVGVEIVYVQTDVEWGFSQKKSKCGIS